MNQSAGDDDHVRHVAIATKEKDKATEKERRQKAKNRDILTRDTFQIFKVSGTKARKIHVDDLRHPFTMHGGVLESKGAVA